MKLNWGTGIVMAFIAFMVFILYFVITMVTDKKYDHDLVTEDYYKQELAFQTEIDAEQNAKALPNNVHVLKVADGIEIAFPETFDFEKIEGTISLYRPSNKQLDFDIPIVLSRSNLLIPDKRLVGGRWDIKIFWKYENEHFLFKENLTY